MISQVWSFSLTVLGAFGLVLVFRYPQHWIGPAWSIVLQTVWLSYGIATVQWGFVASAFMYAGANTYGLLKRRRARQDQAVEWVAPARTEPS
ncbi:nicotinate ribosyltransferase [Gordonia phage Skog]|uniref:Nicotinate ribosyltransferase n=1 Tax=Gordonia phage Skog TaxID=2704033 RepID=A0A6G6XJI4_9CAUD|nr:nicotinate ribosyltransferase [Gordonia phage Skog]QIG58227.1 nicotinate ribosyltransferase [Gordonia phage Skog]